MPLVQFSHSVFSDSATLWTAACQAFLSITNSQSLLKLMSVESVMPSNHLILCCPLLLLSSVFSSIRSFPVSQFFASGGQSIGVSALTSVLTVNIQDWFPLGLTGLISLPSYFWANRVTAESFFWICFCCQAHVWVPNALWGHTRLLKFGAQKGLLQGKARITGSLCSKSLISSVQFNSVQSLSHVRLFFFSHGRIFIGKSDLRGRGTVGRITPPLVGWYKLTGWCSRTLSHLSSGSSQSGVHCLSPIWSYHRSAWGGSPTSCRRTQRYVSEYYAPPLRRNWDPALSCTIVSFCIP